LAPVVHRWFLFGAFGLRSFESSGGSQNSAGKPKETLKVSILVPVRDEEENVGECPAALFRQDYPDYEVLVYEEGSKDGTKDVLSAFSDPRLQVFFGDGPPSGWLGKPGARAKLAEMAKGELLLFLDAAVPLLPRPWLLQRPIGAGRTDVLEDQALVSRATKAGSVKAFLFRRSCPLPHVPKLLGSQPGQEKASSICLCLDLAPLCGLGPRKRLLPWNAHCCLISSSPVDPPSLSSRAPCGVVHGGAFGLLAPFRPRHMERPPHPRERRIIVKVFLALILLVPIWPLPGVAQTEWPDISGSWALFQVFSDYWEVPLLGERPRRIYQIAKIRVDQNDADLTLRSENICAMVFDIGTSLVQISITPAFLSAVKIGPLSGKLEPSEKGIALVIPEFFVLNGVRLTDPLSDPLPTSPDDPRVVDLDGDRRGLPQAFFSSQGKGDRIPIPTARSSFCAESGATKAAESSASFSGRS